MAPQLRTRRETVTERDDLILRYLPLAYSLAARYRRSGETYEDLVQIASLGLVKAADRFDTSRGVAFGAFAAPTIRGELSRYLRDCAWPVHVERPAQQRARMLTAARQRISAALGRQPNVRELAEYLHLDVSSMVSGLLAAAARETASLDAPAPGGEDEAGADDRTGSLDERLEQLPDRVSVFAAARHLSRRDRLIIYLRFSEDLSQAEIARRVGVSQMQVSRMLRDALARLEEITDRPAAA
jgi:RNA polymerase sigma-B factor